MALPFPLTCHGPPSPFAAGWWELSAVGTDGQLLVDFKGSPPSTEVLPLLPSATCYLKVDNCPPPRMCLDGSSSAVPAPMLVPPANAAVALD